MNQLELQERLIAVLNAEIKQYEEYIESHKKDLEAVEIIKKNARLSCRFAKECDKDGHLSGIFAVLEAVLEGEDLEFIERWIKNNAG